MPDDVYTRRDVARLAHILPATVTQHVRRVQQLADAGQPLQPGDIPLPDGYRWADGRRGAWWRPERIHAWLPVRRAPHIQRSATRRKRGESRDVG